MHDVGDKRGVVSTNMERADSLLLVLPFLTTFFPSTSLILISNFIFRFHQLVLKQESELTAHSKYFVQHQPEAVSR